MDKVKQLTREEAIAVYDKGEWQDWTDEQIVALQLYQECLCVSFDRFHQSIEAVLGRPVWTHEFGMNYKGIVAEYEGRQNKPTMQDILDLIPKDKQIIINLDGAE